MGSRVGVEFAAFDTTSPFFPVLDPQSPPLDPPEGRKRYNGGGFERTEDAQDCPCGKAVENRTYYVGKFELHKENGT